MTSEKRREVAANLRRLDDRAKALIEERMNRLGNDSLAKLLVISLGLCVALDGAGAHPETSGDFWDLLADLIDPTCEARFDTVCDGFTCLRCGSKWPQSYKTYDGHGGWHDMRFCPHCGARVVSGDE